MAFELARDFDIDHALVGHQVAGAVNAGHEVIAHVLCGDFRDMARADFAVTVHKGDNGMLLRCGFGLVRVAGLAADIGFVALDNLAGTADRAVIVVWPHGLADTVRHEPGGLVGDAQHAVKLMRADALLGSGHQVRGENPLVERDFGALKDGSDGDGELLATALALVSAFAVRLTLQPGDLVLLMLAAMRAHRSVRPKLGFEMRAGRVLVVINLVGDVDLHGSAP